MKVIKTQDAIGHVLCHDMTQIIPDVIKDARFLKGHIVTEQDIPILLSMGKENLYVWENAENMLHENEGALRLAMLCQNKHMEQSTPKEGKIQLTAKTDGLFLVDTYRLQQVNMIEDILVATRHSGTAVKIGDKLAGTRVIPLVISEETLNQAEEAAGSTPLLSLHPWKLRTAALVVTGNEVFHERIEDKFSPVIIEKLKSFGVTVIAHKITDDSPAQILSAIEEMRQTEAHMIICTGGMSVDPDDCTPGAIKATGAKIISYGAPVLPGAMFLLGYFSDNTPIMGLPGCVMYAGATIFDLVLPKIVAGIPITKQELAAFGNGGLCLGCPECHYPICPFGKGGMVL